jgi:Zn-finger nucleic acid-binding protein
MGKPYHRGASPRTRIDIDCEDLCGDVFVDRGMWEKVVLRTARRPAFARQVEEQRNC